jgi:hypothetical protein
MLRRYGGLLVTPEFLGDDGAVTMRLGPHLVADIFVNGHGLVYGQVGGSRARWQEGRRVLRDGDALVVLGNLRYSRLVIEPVRSPEHREAIERWRQARPSRIEDSLREELAVLRGGRQRRRPSRAAEFAASWHARLGPSGALETRGAAVLGSGRLVYVSDDPALTTQVHVDLEGAVRRRSARSVFGWLVGSGNGVTNEWSLPFTLRAPTIEVATARLLTRLRLRDDLAGNLRELWLSMWPDTAEDVLREAETITAGRDLDDAAKDYLGRVRAAAVQTRSGSGPACRRGARRRRARGSPRGGVGHAS